MGKPILLTACFLRGEDRWSGGHKIVAMVHGALGCWILPVGFWYIEISVFEGALDHYLGWAEAEEKEMRCCRGVKATLSFI